MAFARKGYVYRQYLQNDGRVVIPQSTWRRWLREGKISNEQLFDLGIQSHRRRRVQRRRAVPNREAAPARSSPIYSSDEEHQIATVDEAMPEVATSTDAENPIECAAGAEAVSEVSKEEPNFWDLSDSSESEGTEGLGEEQNVTAEEKLLASVLESSNIGVHRLNEPLVPSLQVSKFETLLMVLHLAMRHGYTEVFLEDMMRFVNELVSVKNAIPETKFLFNKLFMFASKPTIHFYCRTCNIYLGVSTAFKNTVDCEQCSKSNSVTSLNNGAYFLSLSIKSQIKDILNRPHIKLISRDPPVNGENRMVRDITDGLLYESLMKDSGELVNPNALTITFNTDGGQVFKSGPNSLWPIQYIINEIHPSQRFATENVLVAGLWFSDSKPEMDVYLKPFRDELQDLRRNGVVWKKSDGSLCESPVFALCCCVDSPAKAQVQKHTQFNGAYGCAYCLHPNNSIEVVEVLDGRSGLWLANDDSNDENEDRAVLRKKKYMRYTAGQYHLLRTDKQLRQHMLQAQNTGQVTYGSRGESILCSLSYFNVVHGFSIDYLHCILLGVTKRLAGLWFDSTSKGNEYYIGRLVSSVDERLKKISPPSNMRYVRPMSDRVHWKGNEWRAFLLYFALPALVDILPLVYLRHFQKLVTGIYILCKDSMTSEDVSDANTLLLEFVNEYEDLYGEFNMVYNLHLCTHLARSVTKLGPLFSVSSFPFESGMGRLVRLTKGTKGVATQIAKKYLMMFSVPKLFRCDYKARESVIDFCSNVIGYNYLKNSTTCDGVTLLGIESPRELTDEQSRAFRGLNILTVPKFVGVFNRAVKNGRPIIYCGHSTSKQIKHDDSCVRLTNGTFARIELIMKLDVEGLVGRIWCICRTINIATDPSSYMSPHIKQCSLEPFGRAQLIPFDRVYKKCFFICCGERNYVAEFPNTYEKD